MNSNTIIEFFRPVVSESMTLVDVGVFVDGGLADQVVCVMLEFSDSKLFVTVDDKDDSVIVSRLPPSELLQDPEVRATRPPVWVGVVGTPILWIWALLSTQGVIDGLQLEFGTLDTRRVTIQLLGAASMFKVRSWSVE